MSVALHPPVSDDASAYATLVHRNVAFLGPWLGWVWSGFDGLNLERIELRAATTNTASIRLAERLGFVREGVARSAFVVRGKRQDLVVYSLLAGEG